MSDTPLFDIDFYKADHRSQYPAGTEMVFSNFTPRSDRLFAHKSEQWDGKVVVFGIQAFVKEYLVDTWNREFFSRDREEVAQEYKEFMDLSLGEGAIDVQHIRDLHDLGYLPLELRALPEGSRAPMKVPVVTIRNTVPAFFWLVNYIESVMSSELWSPMTNATIAFEYKRVMTEAARKTGASVDFVPLQGHDFSFRGVPCREAAAKAGMGHLTSFIGTDTVPAIRNIRKYYETSPTNPIGISVPATEHSVMCAGEKDSEIETFKRLINDIYPTGIVSIVSDTWDYWKVITEYLPALKGDIMARKPNAIGLNKVVIRPDSGDPVDIICGIKTRKLSSSECDHDFDKWKDWVAEEMDEQFCANLDPVNPHDEETEIWQFNDDFFEVTYEPELNRHDKTYYYVDNWGSTTDYCKFVKIELTPEQKGSIQCMWETFGGTITGTGHKLLDEHIGLIYGDSITLARATEIFDRLEKKGFASTNVVLGIGSFTYQYNTRDSLGFAMKATAVKVNGEMREIFKDPKTDSGVKKSAKGLLKVEDINGEYVLIDQLKTIEETQQGAMVTLFNNGVIEDSFSSFETIKDRLAKEV